MSHARLPLLTASLLYTACAPPAAAVQPPGDAAVTRRDLTVASDPGVVIAVREVVVPGHADGVPVVLVHGAGGPEHGRARLIARLRAFLAQP